MSRSCTLTSLRALALALLALIFASRPAFAQEYPHPREMDLPETTFTRPSPDDVRAALDNGLVAYVVEEHEVPLVTLTVFVRGGTAYDDKQGAAEALVGALQRGAGTDGFRDHLRTMVADYAVTASPERIEVSLNVPAEHAAEAMALLADVLRQPALTEAHVQALRAGPAAQEEAGSGRYGEGGLQAASQRLREAVLGDHPYGHAPTSEEASALMSEDVAAFHEAFFVPSNVVLAVSGDFDAAEARAMLEEHFGDWEGGEAPSLPAPPEVEPATERQIFAYDLDTRQAWLALGHAIPPVATEDQAALDVMNYILGGGHFDTRLFRATRDRRGLTNDASGFPEPGTQGPGTYAILTSGRHEVIPELVDLVMQEVERIRTEPVEEEELFVARKALAEGVYAMRFEDGNATARTFALEWAERRDHEETATYPDRVRAVTSEDVRSAAQRYLHPERMQMVIMGPLDQVREATDPNGSSTLAEFGSLTSEN